MFQHLITQKVYKIETLYLHLEKVNKKSLTKYQINELKLVSIKFKTNYIRCIYHLKGGSMKKRNIHYTNLEILPYLLHFSEVLKRILIIK